MKGTMPLLTMPPQPNVRRADPVHPKFSFPMATNAYVPPVNIQPAPPPPQNTLFSGVGRDAAHAPTPIRQFTSLAIPEYAINGIIGWPFNIAKVPSALVVSMPRGRFNPLRGRTNIQNPKQTTLGEQTTQAVQTSWNPSLVKLI
jgi:hypothetical protein